jgi:hypothetical protein
MRQDSRQGYDSTVESDHKAPVLHKSKYDVSGWMRFLPFPDDLNVLGRDPRWQNVYSAVLPSGNFQKYF